MKPLHRPRPNIKPVQEFTTDGCSGGMSWFWQTFIKPITRQDLPWRGCCVEHDWAYWKGGSSEERRQADLKLAACVAVNGYPFIAALMYYAVRMGGAPYWPFPWRWAYGFRYLDSCRYWHKECHCSEDDTSNLS